MSISSIDSVLARIAQIQATIAPPVLVKATASTTAATSTAASNALTASWDSTLASANGMTSTGLTSTGSTGSTADTFASTLAGTFAAGQSGTAGTGTTGVTGDQIVADAEKYLGVPYVFGGTTTSGLDCSGLVQKTYGDLGITLPRVAADQARMGSAVPSLAQAKPGDILGFGQPAHHVAIYLGNNMMIAAPQPGENVKIQSVYETPASIRRIVGTGSSTAAGSSLPVVAGAAGVAGAGAAGTAGAASGVGQYAGIFAQNEAKYHLPTGMLAAVAQTESGGNAAAVSPSGAQGLMQLMPSTASGLGVNPWVPAQAVQGAAQLLSGYLQKFGSVPLALAAYNAGPGAVEQYGGVPPYTETQKYVRKITGLMAGGAS